MTREQLLALGVSARTVKRWRAAGVLHPVHRGVYLWGHALPLPLTVDMAAVLACGHGAVLSHRSAAELWALLPRRDGPKHVSVPKTNGRQRKGITIHRPQTIEMARKDGVPITPPARTIVDLAATETESVVERAINEALVQRLTTTRQILSLADRRRSRGVAELRRVAAATDEPQLTRSEAEQRTRALIRRARLPAPRANVRIGAYEVDFLWPEQRFVLEVDGYAFHSTRSAFERDREKDAHLAANGYRVARITWRQLTLAPEAVVARIAQALAG